MPELKVVNDPAERGMALIQEYCGLMTKDEQQLQFLVGIVQKHQKNFLAAGRKL